MPREINNPPFWTLIGNVMDNSSINMSFPAHSAPYFILAFDY
ncbi:hypothetical protein SPAB_04571 [Salmonella enterica subsp. enterica serovar Paratyphi B str. SPB7]|uniref:Uncharacterized protein n=1 Tax=Salmonella paratyphi B (strain ATCC BAA-1250 / SPB7) TaxID=1016998 RepID=A0A6C6Z8E3_SALPB|nr:hypothetical protein SPAB_04571 [Salmonella enterica subsp. enterica serovar Paratyphi B str. SPB7]